MKQFRIGFGIAFVTSRQIAIMLLKFEIESMNKKGIFWGKTTMFNIEI